MKFSTKSIFCRSNIIRMSAILIMSMASAIFFSEGTALKDPATFFIGTLWSLVVWMTQWYGNEYIIGELDKRWSWLDYPLKRLTIGFLSLVVYSFLAILIVNICFYWMISGEIPSDISSWVIYNGRVAVGISLVISTILTSVGFFQDWRNTALKEEKLKVEMLDYQYKTLLNQVNPHFLFNSLNVLTSLVYEDQDLAVKFIHQLSKIYRYTLENRERDLVSIKDERSFIESYVFLLKIRFEEALEVKIDLEEQEDKYLLPMALQMIIENSIKHNIVSVQDPLKISIYSEGDKIVVKNNRQAPKKKEESTGFGLDNIRKRLSFLSDEELEIESNEDEFIAKLPILTVIQ